ncbi:MAG TPA: RodZ domain-containing protein [Terriglobales bacterium]|nr:RodZ domain-containing protein [Terriglobales bacterium]
MTYIYWEHLTYGVLQEHAIVASFGAQLKQEREKQGLTLEQISLSTKIGTRMLRALEEEHFDQLPGGIFNKGFIRAYARCLHMNEEQAVAEYMAASGTSPLTNNFEEQDQPPVLELPEEKERAASDLPWGIFAVVLLLAAIGFAAWGFYSRESQKSSDAASPAANLHGVSTAANTEPSPAQKPSEPVDSSAKPVEAMKAAPAGGSPSSQQVIASSSPVPPPAVPARGNLLVVIKAREDSWLSISVDGEIVTRSLLAAPAQKSIRADKEIVIKAGNIGALDFEFNGQKLPTQGDYGEVKTLTFDAHGLQASAARPESPPQSPPKPEETPTKPQ